MEESHLKADQLVSAQQIRRQPHVVTRFGTSQSGLRKILFSADYRDTEAKLLAFYERNAMPQELRFNITFKRGANTVAVIEGQRAIQLEDLTVADVTEEVLRAEQFLEKLTGLRVHIEQSN